MSPSKKDQSGQKATEPTQRDVSVTIDDNPTKDGADHKANQEEKTAELTGSSKAPKLSRKKKAKAKKAAKALKGSQEKTPIVGPEQDSPKQASPTAEDAEGEANQAPPIAAALVSSEKEPITLTEPVPSQSASTQTELQTSKTLDLAPAQEEQTGTSAQETTVPALADQPDVPQAPEVLAKKQEKVFLNNLSSGLRFKDWLIQLGLIFPTIFAEVVLVILMAKGEFSLVGVGALHFGLLGILVAFSWWLHKIGYDIRFVFLLTLLTLGFGPIGPIASLVSFLAFAQYSRTNISFAEWFATLFPEEEDDETEDLLKRILSGQDDLSSKQGMMSFQDIFIRGTVTQKRQALAKISKFFRREFAPALRLALKDESNAIRVQAATVSARIEQDFMSKLMELTEAYHQAPTDKEVILKLARQTDDYAYSGILEGSRETDMFNDAIKYYQAYLDLSPEAYNVKFTLGRMYLQAGESEKARDYMLSCIEDGGMDQPNVILWYLQCLFQLSQYVQIHQALDHYADKLETDAKAAQKAIETMRFWKNGIDVADLTVEVQ